VSHPDATLRLRRATAPTAKTSLCWATYLAGGDVRRVDAAGESTRRRADSSATRIGRRVETPPRGRGGVSGEVSTGCDRSLGEPAAKVID